MDEQILPTARRHHALRFVLCVICAVILVIVFLTAHAHLIVGLNKNSRQNITKIAIQTNNPSLCKTVGKSDSCNESPCARPDLCFVDVAKATKNPAVCDMIGYEPAIMLDCFVAVDNSAEQLLPDCQKISDTVYRGDCVGQAAALLKNTSICDTLPEAAAKVACYGTFMNTTHSTDSSLCESLGKGKENCYYGIAVMQRIPALCDKAGDAESVAFCRSQIERLSHP